MPEDSDHRDLMTMFLGSRDFGTTRDGVSLTEAFGAFCRRLACFPEQAA